MKYFSFNKLEFRPIEDTDLRMLYEHRNDPDTWMNLTNTLPLTDVEQKEWHEKISKNRNNYYLIVEIADKPIGIIRIQDIDWVNSSACIGCDVFKKYRNKGYGTRIMTALIVYCFDYLNLHRLWLLVLETNEAAIKIYKKVGFKEEGRQKTALFRGGMYHDYLMMSFLRGYPIDSDV